MDKGSLANWIKIPNGDWAVIAQYRKHKHLEYNNNILIQALPPKLLLEDFKKMAKVLPIFSEEERNWTAYDRFDCTERLSRYFYPESKSIELYYLIYTIIASGYIGRDPSQPEHVRRAAQIYNAIQDKAGQRLEEFVIPSTSAPSITLFAPSGVGKSRNTKSLLGLFPQVIRHFASSEIGDDFYQVVWLCIDSPITSLKGFCIDIFMQFDDLLGTNYADKYRSSSNSVDSMLAQVAQLAHKHFLGVLVVEEMQAFFKLQQDRDELMRFLTKLDNTLGIPLIRIGTDEISGLFKETFINGRRATGTAVLIWDRITSSTEWEYFFKEMWKYQWTRTPVPWSQEIQDLFYYLTQGIIDLAIKLFKVSQWRAISLRGDEIITTELISAVAEELFVFVKPVLEHIRKYPNNDDWKILFSNVKPLEVTNYRKRFLTELEKAELEELSLTEQMRTRSASYTSPKTRQIILELIQNLGVEASLAKQCAQEIVSTTDAEEPNTNLSALVDRAYVLALKLEQSLESNVQNKPNQKKSRKKKIERVEVEGCLLSVAEAAIQVKGKVYEALVTAGCITDDPMSELFT